MTSRTKRILGVCFALAGAAALLSWTLSPASVENRADALTHDVGDSKGSGALARLRGVRGEAEVAGETEGADAGHVSAHTEASLRSVMIHGIVLDADGAPLRGLTITAAAPSETSRYVAVGASGADGSFEFQLEVPAKCRSVVVDARGVQEGNALVSYPAKEVLTPSTHRVGVSLQVRRAVEVVGRVQGSRQVVYVVELPQRGVDNGWDIAAFRVLRREVRPDTTGAFRTFVRPGRTRIRCASRDGTLGPALLVDARIGRVHDCGLLEPPHGSVSLSVRVLDEVDLPVPGAWIQVSDKDLYDRSAAGLGPLPHFRTDESGRAVLPPVASNSFPITLAAATPDHEAQEARVEYTGDSSMVVTMRLIRRHRLQFRLGGPGARTLADAAENGELRLSLMPLDWKMPAVGRPPSPAEALREGLQRPDSGTESGSSRDLWAHRPEEGEYEVTLSLGGVAVTRRRIAVAAKSEREGLILLLVPAGRQAPARLVLPTEFLPGSMMRLRGALVASARPEAPPIPFSLKPLVTSVDRPVAIWMPEAYDSIVLRTVDEALLPIQSPCASRERSGELLLEPLLRSDCGWLKIRVDVERTSGAPGRWPMHLTSSPPGEGSGAISILSDAQGEASLPVRAGTYEVSSDRRIGSVQPRVTATVAPGETQDVVLVVERP